MFYPPPLTITPRLIDLISRISEALGRWEGSEESLSPGLRRENRIRSIHASLVTDQVTDQVGDQAIDQVRTTLDRTIPVMETRTEMLARMMEIANGPVSMEEGVKLMNDLYETNHYFPEVAEAEAPQDEEE